METKDAMHQPDLFSSSKELHPKRQKISTSLSPLAHLARPTSFESFHGHQKVMERYPFLKKGSFPGLIIWGPPGTGKTTLAHLLAGNSSRELYPFSAVLGGVLDLKKLINSAQEIKKLHNKESIIFIDEIHRFNKAQQDALLPYVESGAFTFIGATTENPRVSVNRALLSRVQIVELKKLEKDDILKICNDVAGRFQINVGQDVLELIAGNSNGDARRGLNILEVVKKHQDKPLTTEMLKQLILENSRDFDRDKDRHYDVISAFIKSMRGSDPQSTALWLAVMLDGGEDPVFIARRMMIFASEDVGNSDPQALTLATSALTAVSNIGMPEARIILAQTAIYLASTVKSNASYLAIDNALAYVKQNPTIEVPHHLRNHSPEKKRYEYPHNYPENFVNQKYTTEEIPDFYQPSENGIEKKLKIRLQNLWKN